MQDLCRTFHGVDVCLVLQSVYRQGRHSVEGLHAEVVVVVFLEHGRGIDEMRGILAVVAYYMVSVTELSATTGNGSILGIGLDAFDKALKAFRREFEGVFLIP